MKSLESLSQLRILYKLVNKENTGTPAQLSQCMGISRSKLYELIEELKSKGVPISYAKKKRSFVFDRPLELHVMVEFRFLDRDELVDISGGCSERMLSNRFLDIFA